VIGRGRKPRVAHLRRRGKVDGLVAAARFRDEIVDRDGRLVDLGAPVRRDAVLALADFSEPDALAAVARAVGDDSSAVRRAALSALVGREDPVAVEALVRAVLTWGNQSDLRARDEAAEALSMLAEQNDGLVAETIGLTYLILNEPPARDAMEMTMLRRFLASSSDDVLDPLVYEAIANLASRHPVRRARAGWLLAVFPEASLGPLRASLAHPDVRLAAAEALGAIGDSMATPDLTAMLTVDDASARRAAALALARIRDPRAIEHLLAVAFDEDLSVRDAAIEALDVFGTLALICAVAMPPRSLPQAGMPLLEQRRAVTD
jgi:HEAT repeat protein